MHAQLRLPALSAFLLLVACGGAPPPASTPAPTEPEASPTVWGILSEDEFSALHEHTTASPPPLHGTTVDIADTRAYLALPEGGAPHAAIIVVHEWWGLNDHIRYWTDRLAALGYAALAVDLYGGQTATDPQGAMSLMRAVDDARAFETMQAAHRFLEEDDRIQAPRTGVIGWCFGGGMALRAGLGIPELDAVVMYYGHTVEDPDALSAMNAPLLGVFANRDESIPPASVDAFDAALSEAGVDHRIVRFDADHAFANPSSARYDAPAAEAAWNETQAFLAAHLPR